MIVRPACPYDMTRNASFGAEMDSTASRPTVLHLINSFEIGGTERQAAALLTRLDRRRYDVRLAVLRKSGAFFQEVASQFRHVPEFPLTSFYNLNALKQLVRLRRLILQERVRVVHAHDFYASLIGTFAARLARVPVIASHRHLKLSDRRVHDWAGRVIHLLADRIVVNSKAIKDHLVATRSAASSKIVVIRNGLVRGNDFLETTCSFEQAMRVKRQAHDEVCSELGLDRTSRLVGVVARLQPVKGHSFLIDAAAQVARLDHSAYFVLVGDGPLRRDLEEQVSQLEITDRVRLLGDRQDINRLVLSFDLFVLPSLHEGLPNAVMEAMAAATPVIATSVGGTPELIKDGETGHLVPPGDRDAIAHRIIFTLRNAREAAKVGWRGRQSIVASYTAERMVESFQRLYDDLLSGRAGR